MKNEARLSEVRSTCTDGRLDGYDNGPDDIHGGGLESTTGGRSGTRYNIPTCAGKRKEHGYCGQMVPTHLAHISSMIPFCKRTVRELGHSG